MKNTYQIDAAHSKVGFSTRHLIVSHVRGRFGGVSATVVYDPAAPEETTIDAAVEVKTVTTNDKRRDGHLIGPEFFNVEKYPLMEFKSKRVESKGAGHYEVTGDLTLHGFTKEEILTVERVSDEGSKIGAAVKGKVKRSDFGLTWEAALEAGGWVVGDEVKLEFDVQFLKQ